MSLNYRNIAARELQEFITENPTMSIGEILYSVIRENNLGVEFKDIKTLSDEQIYSAIEKAKQFEKE